MIIETNNYDIIKINVFNVRKTIENIIFLYLFIYSISFCLIFPLPGNLNKATQIINFLLIITFNIIGYFGFSLYKIFLIKMYIFYLILELIFKFIYIIFFVKNELIFWLLLISIILNIWIVELSYKFRRNYILLRYEDILSLKNRWEPDNIV